MYRYKTGSNHLRKEPANEVHNRGSHVDDASMCPVVYFQMLYLWKGHLHAASVSHSLTAHTFSIALVYPCQCQRAQVHFSRSFRFFVSHWGYGLGCKLNGRQALARSLPGAEYLQPQACQVSWALLQQRMCPVEAVHEVLACENGCGPKLDVLTSRG